MDKTIIKEVQKNRKSKIGVVVSDCQDKTIVVEVTRYVSHPIYKKIYKKSKKYYVHDEDNKSKVGDKVSIIEARPLSKLKRWKLNTIL